MADYGSDEELRRLSSTKGSEKQDSESDETDDNDDNFSLEKTLQNAKITGPRTPSNVYRPVVSQTKRMVPSRSKDFPIRNVKMQPQNDRQGRHGNQGSEKDAAGAMSSRGGRTRPHSRRAPRKKEGLDYNFLRLLSLKSSQEILLELGSRSEEVTTCLQTEPQPENVKLLLRLLCKACECESLVEHSIKLLTAVKESVFFSTYVANFILDLNLAVSSNISSRSEFDAILVNLLIIAKHLLFRMPSSVTVVAGLTEIISSISDGCTHAVTDCLKEVKSLQKSAFTTFSDNIASNVEEVLPPDNFREISIFPTTEDFSRNTEPFLRANKAKGKYEDIEHYLDVQFRLLREDFLCPLREGIAEYKSYIDTSDDLPKHLQDIRMYRKVEVLCPCGTNEGVGYRLQFNSNKRVNWMTTKRLMYGSLLCLSSDKFKTFHFATVVKSEPSLLKLGIVDVQFHNEKTQDTQLSVGVMYDIAETTAYFESYKHVLNGLKNTMQGHIPFENHIVKCEKDIGPPEYLGNGSSLDLRPLLQDDMVIYHERRLPYVMESDEAEVNSVRNANKETLFNRIKTLAQVTEEQISPDCHLSKSINVLDPQEWPSAEDLKLDNSQYEALKLALTHRLAIIQGPPGTGKTHVGLKIMKALIHNKQHWSHDTGTGLKNIDNRPILVICYTNHALDQFLEGILGFYNGDVVRVGGRSKSELINSYSVSNYRAKFRGKLPPNLYGHFLDIRNAKNTIRSQLHSVSLQIVLARKNILHEHTLRLVMGRHFDSLRRYENITRRNQNMQREGYILQWLNIHEDGLNVGNQHAGSVVELERLEYLGAIQSMIDQRQISDNDEEGEKADLFQAHLPRDFVVAFMSSNQQNKTNKFHNSMNDYILKNLQTQPLSQAEVSRVLDVWNLPLEKRWKLYKYWVTCFCRKKEEKLVPLMSTYGRMSELYKDIQIETDKIILKDAGIIGMTTTGAARYQGVLRDIGPRIIVIEEAAEVLEAHIVTSISASCQHLILIGDHKQLRPNPTTYKLAQTFNLDISLFERMINNGLMFSCLQFQHRMRPEISCIMKLIYPELKDHDIVMKYDNVRGVKTNLFFITHSEMEVTDEETRSHSNQHEATFLSQLCNYFIKQGYSQSEITVLTAYSGQERLLRQMLPRSHFPDLGITTIDNFQGEENEIILLSLVRSNPEGKVGFLKTNNRVCVALSRARKGMFIIGNIDQLSSQSELWTKISDTLTEQGKVGTSLTLVCMNHQKEEETSVQTCIDFLDNVPEGGCKRKCDYRLPCGHSCSLYCHPYDMAHTEYVCEKQCPKVLCSRGHKCLKKCYEECSDCKVPIETTLKKCGHTQFIPCYINPNDYICQKPCSFILPCGHVCREVCGAEHTKACYEFILTDWPCSHEAEVPCSQRNICPCICGSELPCGHQCKGLCSECNTTGSHKLCTAVCGKRLDCQHQCSGLCSNCSSGGHKACTNICIRTLICGHTCNQLCKEVCRCTEYCSVACCHGRCENLCEENCDKCDKPCSHSSCTVSCSSAIGHVYSDLPCFEMLPCGHFCAGLSDEVCPTFCKICTVKDMLASSTVGKLIFQLECGHHITVDKLDKLFQKPDSFVNILEPYRCSLCLTCITSAHRYKRQLLHYMDLKAKANERCKNIEIALSNFNISSTTYDVLLDKTYKSLCSLFGRTNTEQLNMKKKVNSTLVLIKDTYHYASQPFWDIKFIAAVSLLLKSLRKDPNMNTKEEHWESLLQKSLDFLQTLVPNDIDSAAISTCKASIHRMATIYFLSRTKELLSKHEDLIDICSVLMCNIGIALVLLRDENPLTETNRSFCHEVCREVSRLLLEHTDEKVLEVMVCFPEFFSREHGFWFYCRKDHVMQLKDAVVIWIFPDVMMDKTFPNVPLNDCIDCYNFNQLYRGMRRKTMASHEILPQLSFSDLEMEMEIYEVLTKGKWIKELENFKIPVSAMKSSGKRTEVKASWSFG